MKPSLKAIRAEKRKREKALADNLERIKAFLIDRGALKIVLFGSFADVLEHPKLHHGARRGTDLDILCVMPPAKTGKAWMREIYEETDRDVDCDILAYTEEEFKDAKRLDDYYIPTRCPNGLPDGIPARHYDDPEEAERALSLSEHVIKLVKSKINP
jgi:predicted nucleotidyltransferase